MIRAVIADDHVILRQSLRLILEMQGDIEVVGEAGDGEEALDLTKELHPDVIVLDIEMPNMDGIVAASEIYAACPDTRILALSRHSEQQYVTEMFASGASGYILKDSAVDELIKAIEAVVNGQNYCSPKLGGILISGFSKPRRSDQESKLSLLTPREIEVLQLIAEGLHLKEIASKINVSYKTVATHRAQIISKLRLRSDVELARFAIREGISDL